MSNQGKTADTLQDLLQKNYDAEAGFKEVMTKAQDANLKNWLKERAAQRNHFATELDKELHTMNAQTDTTTSWAADAHRAWINVKTALSSDKDESILEECIRGEEAAVEHYREALKGEALYGEVRQLVEKQCASVEQTLSKVRRLEDIVG